MSNETVKLRRSSNSSTKKKGIIQKIKNFFKKAPSTRKSSLSYTPTVNKQLVTLKTKKRIELGDCNNRKAFELKEPLKISIPGYFYGRYCVPYYENIAKKYLLKQLSANKHVDPSKIVPPKQLLSNCWFNAMFVTFFISDKGRKFFHFLRQLMIEGKQANGNVVEPEKLRDAFALLNFGVEAALTGNKFARILNTNAVIRRIYEAIPGAQKGNIRDIKEAGNPLAYYMSIVNYLHDNSLNIHYQENATEAWREALQKDIDPYKKPPHIIVLEIYSEEADKIKDRPVNMQIGNHRYSLDSAVVRDTSGRHFSTVLTAEKSEMAFDGLSYHRIKPMNWKWRLNKDENWGFHGSVTSTGIPLKWNFSNCYQLLFYYRVSK